MKTSGANDILGSLSPRPHRPRGHLIPSTSRHLPFDICGIERTQDKVDSEYNLLHWQKVLSNKAWINARSLPDFLAPPDLTERLRKVDNRIIRIDGRKYYQYRMGALGDLIARHCGNAKVIVELGTGYGYNLFSLHLSHPDWLLKGFDISPNG